MIRFVKRKCVKDWKIVGLLLFAFLSSCATDAVNVHKRIDTKCGHRKENSTFSKNSKELEKKSDKIIVQNGHIYKLVSTPFGYIKHEAQSLTNSRDIRESSNSGQKEKSEKPAHNIARPHGERKLVKSQIPESEHAETVARQPAKPLESEVTAVVLNFDDADIYEVVRVMADLLKINYIVDPTVRGKVTIHTAGKLSYDELWSVFHRILEVNGLTIVKQKGLYRITPLKGVSTLPIPAQLISNKEKEIPKSERVVIQVIPLKYLAPSEMQKLLKPFVSPDGLILADDKSDVLMVVDRGENILKILEIVNAFDLDLFDKFHYRFYQLVYADANDVAKTLNGMLKHISKRANVDLGIITIERLNMLLVISSTPRVFKEIEPVLKTLDIPSENAEPKIYVYYVKNGEANQLASILGDVFSRSSSTSKNKPISKEKTKQSEVSPIGNPLSKAKKKKTLAYESNLQEALKSVASGTLRGKIRIVPDEVRNALIIEALPADYRIIRSVLEKIDVLPRQVLIEVTIAEISLDAADELGLEFEYKKDPKDLGFSILGVSSGSSGLHFTIGQVDKWSATLSALASKHKVNILASPSLLASDNKEAIINISTEVPVASSEYQYTSGETPVIQTNIEYRNTGLILSVTPHINERGLVTMKLKQEVSNQSQNVMVGGKAYPSFFKRSVDTTLTVKHGQTIVIGGLIKQNKESGRSGVPWLVKIPVLGFLFGKKNSSFEKSELILLITPHVITNLGEVDSITQEFKRKVSNVTKLMLRQ